jgi:hypothetical protein
MAHTFLTPSVIARAVLAVLRRETVLPQLVWTDASAEFQGRIGDTVTVRLPAKLTARTRALRATGAISTDDAVEFPVAVALASDVYSAVAIPDAVLTLDVQSFVDQVLAPQLAAVVEALEDNVAATITGATYGDTIEFDGADPFQTLIDANKVLNDNNVPRAGRRLVVGSAIEAAMLADARFSTVEVTGDDALPALRDARISRKLGFDIYGSNAIPEDEAYAFHRTAFVMANRAPVVPSSVQGSSQVLEGLAVRSIMDYDSSTLQDRSVINSYVGSGVTEDPDDPTDEDSDRTLVRAVKIEDAVS